jgi:xanthine dehydrogenase iron-sulfur cluster and FAD-binding subunit A
MPSDPTFVLNGRRVELGRTDPTQPLLRWLHRHGLHGTKEGCGDGDCGACTVALLDVDAQGRGSYRAINSCLFPVGLLPGREITTVEALAEGARLHPVQQALVDCAGSQCGYCTPGFVMSLFCASHAADRADALGDDAIAGNLCRCTGYAPIRTAAARLAAGAAPDDAFAQRLAAPRKAPGGVALGEFFSPTSLEAALALKATHPYAAWIAGGTDLGVDFGHHKVVAPAFIALDRIPALQVLEFDGKPLASASRTLSPAPRSAPPALAHGARALEGSRAGGSQATLLALAGEGNRLRIGAAVPLERLRRDAHGLFPSLDTMLEWFAGRQVRNRATLGGNLGTASPIGDLLPVLLALDATIELRGPQGARTIAAADFFTAYRRTERATDEIVVAVDLPRRPGTVDAAFKLAKRPTDDISIVAAAFALARDDGGRVTHARLAYGGVAATPRRAIEVEAFLLGRRLDDATVAEAQQRLAQAFEPLDDHRGSAAYRRALCGALFAQFVAQLQDGASP